MIEMQNTKNTRWLTFINIGCLLVSSLLGFFPQSLILLWPVATAFYAGVLWSNNKPIIIISPILALIGTLFSNSLVGLDATDVFINVLATLSYTVIGLTFIVCSKKGASYKTKLIAGATVATVIIFLIYDIYVLTNGGEFNIKAFVAPYDSFFDRIIEQAVSLSNTSINGATIQNEVKVTVTMLETLKPLILPLIPGLIFFVISLVSLIALEFCWLIAYKTDRENISSGIALVRMDKLGALIFIVSSFMPMFLKNTISVEYIVMTNLVFVLYIPFLVSGFGSLNAILKNYELTYKVRRRIMIGVALTAFIPILNLLSVVAFIGAWDAFLNYRKLPL